MKVQLRLTFVCVVAMTALIAGSSHAFQKRFTLPAPPTKSEIEHGRYLVEEIAKCPECHTPRKPDGELDGTAWLQGASIWIRPEAPIANWADRAPALAGRPSLTDAQAEKGLAGGSGVNRGAPPPPIGVFQQAPPTARAVLAELKSLAAAAPVLSGVRR